MKIKTFTFKISGPHGTADFGGAGCWSEKYDRKENGLTTSKEIDKTINKFVSDVDVVSISVDHQTTKHHNNGGCDDVQAIYTIIYNEKGSENAEEEK